VCTAIRMNYFYLLRPAYQFNAWVASCLELWIVTMLLETERGTIRMQYHAHRARLRSWRIEISISNFIHPDCTPHALMWHTTVYTRVLPFFGVPKQPCHSTTCMHMPVTPCVLRFYDYNEMSTYMSGLIKLHLFCGLAAA